MDKRQLLKDCIAQLTEVELKLKMCSFMMSKGLNVDKSELDNLLDRMRNLKKIISELEKS